MQRSAGLEAAMKYSSELIQTMRRRASLAASLPAPTQQVLKVGSTRPSGPFTFFDTKSNQIQA